MTQCPRCKRFADKYVEHDYVVIFIDLVLIKPQASVLRQTISILEMLIALGLSSLTVQPARTGR